MFGHVICLKFKNIRYTHAKIKNIIQYKNVKVQKKVLKLKQSTSASKGETFRKPCFIETQKSHNANVKNKV